MPSGFSHVNKDLLRKSTRTLAVFFPLLLSVLRLKALGVFGVPPVGGVSSDFYALASIGRLALNHPEGLPQQITDFSFPLGIGRGVLPELFSDWLWQAVLRFFTSITREPITALWMGIVASTLFNIWGVWILLWRRFARHSVGAVIVAWSLLCLHPGIWARSVGHWYLSWIPILLACLLAAWDLWVTRTRPRAGWLFLIHFLLMAQSIYYAVFLVLLHGIWLLTGLSELFGSSRLRREALRFAVIAAMAYASAGSISILNMGGRDGLALARQSAHRAPDQVYHLGFRLRELLKGGSGSPWNRFAQKAWHQKPEAYARDGETFPAPLPKLWLLAALVWAVIFKRSARMRLAWAEGRAQEVDRGLTESELGRARRFALMGVIGLLLLGLQETYWFRVYGLFPILPFLRTYARLLILILGVMSLGLASFWAGRVRPLLVGPRQSACVVGVALVLLWVDLGWNPQALELVASHPCFEVLKQVREFGAPILLTRAPGAGGVGGCAGIHYESYPVTGLPQLASFFEGGFAGVFKKGDPLCLQLANQVREASRAHVSGHVLWWYEGTPEDWEKSARCFKAPPKVLGTAPLAVGEPQLVRRFSFVN